jgi:Nucleoside-diphosphate-sugar pyrophosphorylase involved in lipopolysaccharide biosynthesis/translation initiation factor 2B, gamma/epsilon subunits (eIF-2Bgamma/eIF-2Bepsilon)
MKAMILAAGRGERMRPLSDRTPKPLLAVAGKPLIQYHVEALVGAGIADIVVNLAWLGERIERALGDGSRYGAQIVYTRETPGALGSGGGILNALPLLGASPFLVVAGDVWMDYPFDRLSLDSPSLAHLVLVDNPPHHVDGDFVLREGRVLAEGGKTLTFSGIGIYRPELFHVCLPRCFPIAPLLYQVIARGLVTGEHYRSLWVDVGTPERLAELRKTLGGD